MVLGTFSNRPTPFPKYVTDLDETCDAHLAKNEANPLCECASPHIQNKINAPKRKRWGDIDSQIFEFSSSNTYF
jgi:hypothetical protein